MVATGSTIEWCHDTWNPTRGCTRVSPGCTNCYAEHQAHRQNKPGGAYDGLTLWTPKGVRWTGRVIEVEDDLNTPLQRRAPRRFFVNSMSDVFHEGVSEDYIQRIFDVMCRAHWHEFVILTKREERLVRLASQLPWHSNIWMGLSIESEDYLYRIDYLRQVPGAVRVLSLEPLLGPVPEIDLEGIGWVIVGGESGTKNRVRPCDLNWIRDVVRQCRAADVPVFVKQVGSKPLLDGTTHPVTAWKGNDPSEWPKDLRIQQLPSGAIVRPERDKASLPVAG